MNSNISSIRQNKILQHLFAVVVSLGFVIYSCSAKISLKSFFKIEEPAISSPSSSLNNVSKVVNYRDVKYINENKQLSSKVELAKELDFLNNDLFFNFKTTVFYLYEATVELPKLVFHLRQKTPLFLFFQKLII